MNAAAVLATIVPIIRGWADTPLSRANEYAAPLFEQITPLQPDDVAETVAFALTRPRHVVIREIALQPMAQELS